MQIQFYMHVPINTLFIKCLLPYLHTLGDGAGGQWLVRMEWCPAGWSVCLPLLISPCTIKSRSSLLAPAHPGGPGKRVVKWLWCRGGYTLWNGMWSTITWTKPAELWSCQTGWLVEGHHEHQQQCMTAAQRHHAAPAQRMASCSALDCHVLSESLDCATSTTKLPSDLIEYKTSITPWCPKMQRC